jgi:hypothetical protein
MAKILLLSIALVLLAGCVILPLGYPYHGGYGYRGGYGYAGYGGDGGDRYYR